MNLRVLEYFLTVADEENITRAAEILHVSQPTISRQLMELERELGKTLLIRTSKNVSLTPDGHLFRETARNMLALYQKAMAERTARTELEGDIYLGAGETESFSFLAERIKAFQNRYPKVCFHIISENAERIRDEISSGLLDLGFIMHSVNTDRYETLAFDRTECWGVAVRREHPLAARESLPPRELRAEPLILPENSIFRREILRWVGGNPPVSATYNLVRNAVLLARSGAGSIVCLSDPAFGENGLIFLPFKPAREASPLLIWKKKPVLPPAVLAFLAFMSDTESE